MRPTRKGETQRIVLHAGEKGCERCGVDLVRRMTWTRFCDSCRAERTRATNRRIAKERLKRLKANRLCIWCGDPVVEGNQHCAFHREKMKEFRKAHYLKKTRGDGRYTNCEVCGVLIRKNTNVKYCRPCSVDRTGPAWYARIYTEQRKEKGLCVECGKTPAAKDRVCCEECLAKKSAVLRRIYNERKREGLCTECGRVPKGKTLRCEKCRLDQKLKNLRREIRK